MSDLVERARNWWLEAMDERDAMKARIEALKAELAAAKTINREVLYRENDDLRKVNGEAKVRIEALEAAGKRLAEALAHLIEFTDMTGQGCAAQQIAARSALAAWRVAEKGGRDA